MAAVVEAICHPFQKQNSDSDTHSLAVNHRLHSLGKVTAANVGKLKKWEKYEWDDYEAKNDGCPEMPAW